ncbi:flavin reductase family protein [Parenemella sanctibonifatiensis]|uniref:NADPH-flavin oxidoreductase n=1 Tax=Parenemella sanctibonifatiensis TaxID=2016505 RepID=A0A255E240_9ACTN|nr:flavin reductase family protein [Parenemella sanctibonifatiensis]OYN85380.1 NADPH-flavin oxidoreductase [Parenemella sanctibonifatiensis]
MPSLYDSFARYASGLTVVNVAGPAPASFVAGSVLTASVDPFTIAVSVGERREGLAAMLAGEPWAVSVLAGRHLPLVRAMTAKLPAGLTGAERRQRRTEAMLEAGAVASEEGPLWLPDALVTLWCRTHSSVPVHDQVIVVGDVIRGGEHGQGQPLVRWGHGFWSFPTG